MTASGEAGVPTPELKRGVGCNPQVTFDGQDAGAPAVLAVAPLAVMLRWRPQSLYTSCEGYARKCCELGARSKAGTQPAETLGAGVHQEKK